MPTPAWHHFDAIATAIGESTQAPFAARSIDPVGGGSIHHAWRIDDGRREFFVKTGDVAAGSMFTAEVDGLLTLSAIGAVPTPRFITQGTYADSTFLVLEYLELAALDREGGARLGTALANLHRHTGPAHGWSRDNFIGATPQHNATHLSWPHFFGDRRLRPQFELALHKGMDHALVERGHALIERIGGLFIDYRPPPSLLHGDLWAGNAAQDALGEPVIFDPACYMGDRETDIAMAELFGGFPTSFFTAYREAWPLDSGYEARKPLYNLYHILNHYNLFGGAYLGQAQRMIDRLLADLKR